MEDRWRPACSRSTSDHDRIDESTVSISNRFGSARGVVRNEMRMLVTNRLHDGHGREANVSARDGEGPASAGKRLTDQRWCPRSCASDDEEPRSGARS